MNESPDRYNTRGIRYIDKYGCGFLEIETESPGFAFAARGSAWLDFTSRRCQEKSKPKEGWMQSDILNV
jgi:hypothetical protein